jgi:hypothetical protein
MLVRRNIFNEIYCFVTAHKDTAMTGETIKMKKLLISLKAFLPESIKRILRCMRLYFNNEVPSDEIPQIQLDGCILYQNRLSLLQSITSRDTVAAEVGVLYGDFSKEILDTTEIKNLTLIDINTERFKNEVKHNERTTVVNVLSEEFKIVHDFDWIYIDADHSYSGVKRDIEVYKNFLKPGGYMVFNDYSKVSVRSLGSLGVHKAVNEFICDSGWKVAGLAFQGNCLYDIAVRKPT